PQAFDDRPATAVSQGIAPRHGGGLDHPIQRLIDGRVEQAQRPFELLKRRLWEDRMEPRELATAANEFPGRNRQSPSLSPAWLDDETGVQPDILGGRLPEQDRGRTAGSLAPRKQVSQLIRDVLLKDTEQLD